MSTDETILQTLEELFASSPSNDAIATAVNRVQERLRIRSPQPNDFSASPTSAANLSIGNSLHSDVRSMVGISLASLDRRRIAIKCNIAGREVILRGEAQYEQRGRNDGILHIKLPSADIDEICVREAEWNGTIAVDAENGCDYLITLNSLANQILAG